MEPITYTHTVRCFDDKTLTKHFAFVNQAAAYANQLLRAGHKCKIYPYREPKKYIDYVAERLERDGRL